VFLPHWVGPASFSPSCVVGVGQADARIASVRIVPVCMTPVFVVCLAALLASVVVGVGHNEDSLSSVRRFDETHRNFKNPAVVTEISKRWEYRGLGVAPRSSNVFPNNPTRRAIADDSKCLRESIPRIFSPHLEASVRMRLAGRSADDDVDWAETAKLRGSEVCVAFIRDHPRETRFENRPCPLVGFAVSDESELGPLGGEIHAADA